jgi:hypothetical protein
MARPSKGDDAIWAPKHCEIGNRRFRSHLGRISVTLRWPRFAALEGRQPQRLGPILRGAQRSCAHLRMTGNGL